MAETLQRNVGEYTVSEISAALKRTVEDAYGYVRVRGEISGFRGRHTSGHAYFTLKDDKARLEAVIWASAYQRLRFQPSEGLEVIATGKLTTFPGSSKYQIVIDTLEPAGIGALMALLEERRKRLAAEGLFARERKKPLPFLPRVIGVITSPTGAVIRDILHRLSDRFPVHVVLWPVRVQGETAAAEVANAIRGFNELAPNGRVPIPDVLIVARGGGSLEDLWAFNEEIVVRAAAASRIPLISAVGHETDTTLIDHAADLRAPTPTGAAELAVPVRSELVLSVAACSDRQRGAVLRFFDARRREFRSAARALPRADDLLATQRRSLDEAARRLSTGLGANVLAHRALFAKSAARLSIGQISRAVTAAHERLAVAGSRKLRALEVGTERKGAELRGVAGRLRLAPILDRMRQAERELRLAGERAAWLFDAGIVSRADRVAAVAKVLETLSYRSVLARGFALVKTQDGAPLSKAEGIRTATPLDIEFHDGRVGAVATTNGLSEVRPPPPPKRKLRPPPSSDQGSLF